MQVDYWAARIALLGLRTRFPAASNERFVFAPSLEPVDLDSAANTLAALPKPVTCKATVLGESLSIECLHSSVPHDKAAPLATWKAALSKACSGQGEDAQVLIESDGKSLRVTVEAFLSWIRDYDMPYMIALRDPRLLPKEECAVVDLNAAPTILFRESPR